MVVGTVVVGMVLLECLIHQVLVVRVCRDNNGMWHVIQFVSDWVYPFDRVFFFVPPKDESHGVTPIRCGSGQLRGKIL